MASVASALTVMSAPTTTSNVSGASLRLPAALLVPNAVVWSLLMRPSRVVLGR